jgi:hypothetical protein
VGRGRPSALQQTGHATDGSSGFNGFNRVSRLLSEAFDRLGEPMAEPHSRIENLYLPPSLVKRTRFYSEADQSIVGTIRCGVLFVMAFWSGTSRQAFAELKRSIEANDPNGRLELVVVDTDGCPSLYELPEFADKLHGHGEAAWVLDGTIVYTSGLGFHPECMEPNTRLLLSKCPVE